jgi:transketolase
MERDWNAMVKKYEKANPDAGAAFASMRSGTLPEGWEKTLPAFDGVDAKATRCL